VSGIHHDDMVQTFPPNGVDDAFCVGVLPKRTIGRKDFLDAKCLCVSAKLSSVYGVPVTDKVLRLFIHAAGLDKLLCSPGSGWMVGYIKMHNSPSVVAENYQREKYSEISCWNRKEIE